MSETAGRLAMGWIPDYPDIRDYTSESESVQPMLVRLVTAQVKAPGLAPKADLREWCPPIENQDQLGSCTAHAGVGLIEYFERRSFGKYIDASRLFLYKVTRNLMRLQGDTGASLRATMRAMVLFGVPPEEYWPYDLTSFDAEPSAFLYSFGQSYRTITYYRLDPPGESGQALLEKIKTHLTQGLPSMFGFTVYESIQQAQHDSLIPFPAPGERVLGGHAVDAVGYDDTIEIKNTNPKGTVTTGALLIRNSWGMGWGANGYGWLPYDYVLRGLASDWWSVLKSEWVDSGQFA